MPWEILNPSWSSLNAQRRYPLTGDATARDQTGDFTLPDDFLVWLGLPVHAGMDVEPARFFVRHIGAYATGYSIVIGYQPLSGPAVNVATAIVAAAGFAPHTTYDLGGIAPFADAFGKLTIGTLDGIAAQPPGFWTFDLAATRLEPDAIRPILRGVTALTAVNGNERSEPLQGDVELVAGANCRLDVSQTTAGARITIHFLQGEGTSAPCDCVGDAAAIVPIARLGGITPTAAGEFRILGSDCLKVEPVAHGIRLVDVCSQPCCGCAELEAITQDLERLNQERALTQDFVARLQVATDTMQQVVLGSRLSDRSCFQG